jgi:hypothetical protein
MWLNSAKLLSCGYQCCKNWQDLLMETVQCINLFKHDYCRFVCQVQHPLLLAERKISPEGQWFNSHTLGNLRRHNWHFTLLLNCVWAALQSGAIVENLQLIVHMKHWCIERKVDECFWWCRVSEICRGRCNPQQHAVSHPNSLFEISLDSELQQHSPA